MEVLPCLQQLFPLSFIKKMALLEDLRVYKIAMEIGESVYAITIR